MEDIDFSILTEEEQKIIRNYQNSKLNIYQTPENKYLFKFKSDFDNSYEHREIQNNSVQYLTSSSNLVYYTLGTECGSIYEAKNEIRNNFNSNYKTSINNKSEDEFKQQIKEIKYKINEHRFKNEPQFKALNDLINESDFDKKMKENNSYRKSVFLNQFFPYHKKCDEIINKYSQLLSPMLFDLVKEKVENYVNDYF